MEVTEERLRAVVREVFDEQREARRRAEMDRLEKQEAEAPAERHLYLITMKDPMGFPDERQRAVMSNCFYGYADTRGKEFAHTAIKAIAGGDGQLFDEPCIINLAYGSWQSFIQVNEAIFAKKLSQAAGA